MDETMNTKQDGDDLNEVLHAEIEATFDDPQMIDAREAIAELRRLAALSSPEVGNERMRAQIEQKIGVLLAQSHDLLEPLIDDGRSREEQLQFLADLEASLEEAEQGRGIDSSEVFARLQASAIMPAHILVVDGNPAFLRVYREILEQEGLQVSTVASAKQAAEVLEAQGAIFNVVLIDQKMPGERGSYEALELATKVGLLAPFAKVIIASGYADSSEVAYAFRAGIYDYMVKNAEFDILLRARIRNAVEITRAQRKLAMTTEATLQELRALWLQVRGETDRNRKGGLLEQLIYLLFQVTPGFGRVITRLTNRVEEISIVVENCDNEAPWKGECAHLVGECKNWSSRCGAEQVQYFRGKLIAKHRRVRTGFLIAPGGFSPDAHEDARTKAEGKRLIILIDDADLERWITANDRLAVLRSFHERAVFGPERT
jgi:CheY-like chemotaxis protein